jgi:uncharacterized Fe-S cluster-containing radical SAM superfamily protein
VNLKPYRGTLVAPYLRFRGTAFYGAEFTGGTYTGDIMWCPWTCEGCWSRYGWRNVAPPQEHTPDRVLGKLYGGMQRRGQTACRISGGEPTLFWPHVSAVIDLFLDETAGKVMRVAGQTRRGGEPMKIVIETNGSTLQPRWLDALQETHGDEAARLVLSLGIKATSGPRLAALTGQAPRAAEAAFRRQIRNLIYICEQTQITPYVSVLNKYSDPNEFATIQALVEESRPGLGRHVGILPYRGYGRANQFFTPKRMRESSQP